MKFDWKKFCDEHQVLYVEEGPNTARGHISIRCPWCGSADESQHMGLQLDEREHRWGCWRNTAHRGKYPSRLIQALLDCSFQTAKEIIDNQNNNPDDYEEVIARLKGQEPEQLELKVVEPDLAMPPEFKPIHAGGYSRRFLDYLANKRGFGHDALEVVRQYDLRYCMAGDFAWRIIYPVYCGGKLRDYTGRAIGPATLRYRSLSDKIKNYLAQEDVLATTDADTLLVTEGPIDFLKMDFYGRRQGVVATCTFGLSLTEVQGLKLSQYARRFKRVVSFSDVGAEAQNLSLADRIVSFDGPKVFAGWLPKGVEDPGALTGSQAEALAAALRKTN